jgi:hypothetical protein
MHMTTNDVGEETNVVNFRATLASMIKTAWRWLGRNLGALLCGALALVATYVAMQQSYQLGWSLAVTDSGKQSMAMWMAIIDVCTAALPIAAMSLIAVGYSKSGKTLLVVTIGYMLFSVISQVGFALSEREAKAQKARATNQAIEDARAERKKLIEDQIKWNNGVVVNRTNMRSSRQEAIASTERLINAVGEVDTTKIVVLLEDPQAAGLASLGIISERGVKIVLAIWAAVLVILAKPIFWGLATFFFLRARARAAGGRPDQSISSDSGSSGDDQVDKNGRDVIPFTPSTGLRAAPREVSTKTSTACQPAASTSRPRMSTIEFKEILEAHARGASPLQEPIRAFAKRSGRSYATVQTTLKRIRARLERSAVAQSRPAGARVYHAAGNA